MKFYKHIFPFHKINNSSDEYDKKDNYNILFEPMSSMNTRNEHNHVDNENDQNNHASRRSIALGELLFSYKIVIIKSRLMLILTYVMKIFILYLLLLIIKICL